MKELRCRALVVGGGLAGMLAAHWAGEGVVLATRGLGATALSSATFWQVPRHAAEFGKLAETCGAPYGQSRVVNATGGEVDAYAPRWCILDGSQLPVRLGGFASTRPGSAATVGVDWGVPEPTWARAAARVERDPAVRGQLVRGITALHPGVLLLPPVLGLTPSTRAEVERGAGRRLVEVAACQGALGHRLLHALWQGLLRKPGATALEEAQAVSLDPGPPHRTGLVLGKLGRRTIDVVADAVVLCTGAPLTALRQEGSALVEPLTGAVCAELGPVPDNLLGPQPQFEARLPVDRRHRVSGLEMVFAAGALGGGFGLAGCVDAAWEVCRQL